MKRTEMEKAINEVVDTIYNDIGTSLLNINENDLLKGIKIMKLTRDVMIAQNNDIEDLKEELYEIKDILRNIRYELKKQNESQSKGEA